VSVKELAEITDNFLNIISFALKGWQITPPTLVTRQPCSLIVDLSRRFRAALPLQKLPHEPSNSIRLKPVPSTLLLIRVLALEAKLDLHTLTLQSHKTAI
jgi:hypothetical protein